jgi:predicted lipoprotein with Yx(FWY)xxD motif
MIRPGPSFACSQIGGCGASDHHWPVAVKCRSRDKGAAMRTIRHHRLFQLLAVIIMFFGVGATIANGASAATHTSGKAGGKGAKGIDFKAIGPARATGKTISLAKGKAGIFVIGPNGHSLYVYDKDKGTTSACGSTCATFWPALTAKGALTIGPNIFKVDVGRADGQKPDQVTYFGHLLYYYKGDTAPGQTNGTSIPGFHLLGPFGNVMLPRG